MTTTRRTVRPSLGSVVEQAIAGLELLVAELEELRRDLAAQTPPAQPDTKADGRDAYTAEEVAGRLGVSYRTTVRLINDGELAAIKAGRHWLVPAEAVTRYLDRATAAAESRRND